MNNPNQMSSALDNFPKISVVTPSYNQGKYIEACLSSVLEQNYPNLEYIVIDGGSTDNSLDIIQRYASRLDYWISEPDEGQSDAINRGFHHATGDLVAWLNTDDFYLPGALHRVAEAYRQRPDAPFYFGDGWRVDEIGRPKTAFFPDGQLIFNRQALIYGLNYILQPATFMNRSLVEQLGGLDIHYHYGMDTDLWIRLSALGQPVPVPEKLAASREYETTKTATGSFKRLEELRQIAEKYAGAPVTPGYLCYYLDTLDRYVRQHPDEFSTDYPLAINGLWGATSQFLANYGARPDGFPIQAEPPQFLPEPTQTPLAAQPVRLRIGRKIRHLGGALLRRLKLS